ncbi:MULTISPECIES: TRAP transporter large permease subunit [unclassified Caballeronia]|uniref:TRAP transporter large permease n=1 Tax=unclassified Caballeronia TaxID=2646786 RepID=UPI001F3C3B7E|nr:MULTISPECIES: TRAP transporter large permease subunit [unclassified Caballeronia]MCE4547256.1 TRAP transporter large permease subunit [Caballeronia sp. PC1]MCE4575238.1 TRAP transporter large permease subunit [Caballeronia sp. CLC5]
MTSRVHPEQVFAHKVGAPKDRHATSKVVRVGSALETAIKWITEVPAALLLVAEVVLLLTNVTCRYVLRDPLIWGDELASILFIWLSMLGAVVALRRGEHMRLTIFVARMSPQRRAFAETLGNFIVMTFVLLLVRPASEWAMDEWIISTPALDLPNTVSAAAIPVAAGLMLVLAITRLLERSSLRDCVKAVALVGGVAVALYFARQALAPLTAVSLILFFAVGVITIICLGVPIMVAFGVCTFAYLATVTGAPLSIVVSTMNQGMSSLILLAVPLFILLGALMEAMGLAEAMIRFLASLIGHKRGGLAYVLIGAMYLVSGISGSKVADMAALAPGLFPEMKKRGANEGDLVAMLSSSAAMSETIPPSLVLITIGSVTGVSIAALFTGGFMPAVVGAVALAAVVWFKSRGEILQGVQRASRVEIGRAFLVSLPALALPFVIRAAVVEGIATATEVATIGVAYTCAAGLLLYRRFDWSRLYPILVESASLSGAILIIIGCATAMGWALTQSGFSAQLASLMMAAPGGSLGFLAISAVTFVMLGSFLEGIPAIVLFGPLLFPIARAMGISDVHYAMVVVFAMGLGLFAPPLGLGFYAACAVSKVDPSTAMRRVWPYLGALAAALIVIVLVPWVSTGFLQAK